MQSNIVLEISNYRVNWQLKKLVLVYYTACFNWYVLLYIRYTILILVNPDKCDKDRIISPESIVNSGNVFQPPFEEKLLFSESL